LRRSGLAAVGVIPRRGIAGILMAIAIGLWLAMRLVRGSGVRTLASDVEKDH
jgi:hypothetical protein